MAQPAPNRKSGNLRLRLLSAALFAPPAFAALYFGSPWFDTVVVLAALLMSWEWARICCDGSYNLWGWILTVGVVAGMSAMIAGSSGTALAALAACAVIFLAIMLATGRCAAVYMAFGTVLIGLFALSLLWIRDFPGWGREITIWLVLAVCFTDTGGYLFGRALGGAKLAPRISPNKTWAGLGGGVLLATIWSCFWLTSIMTDNLAVVIAAGAAVAVISQMGDLTVSAVKRRFGVKDASGLIPGHGGVLDRLDGSLLTAPSISLVLMLSSRGLG